MISYYKRINLHIHRTTMLIVVNNNDIILQANKLTYTSYNYAYSCQ